MPVRPSEDAPGPAIPPAQSPDSTIVSVGTNAPAGMSGVTASSADEALPRDDDLKRSMRTDVPEEMDDRIEGDPDAEHDGDRVKGEAGRAGWAKRGRARELGSNECRRELLDDVELRGGSAATNDDVPPI